jgi:hypothetical protein
MTISTGMEGLLEEMEGAVEDRWLPWVVIFILLGVLVLVYGRGNHNESKLRHEIQAYQTCIADSGFKRNEIESRCLPLVLSRG